MGALFTLGDYITTQKGYAFKSKWFESEGTPIVKVSDFTEDSISPSNLVKISEELAKNYPKFKLATDDVVIQTVGSWPSNPASVVGKTIRVPRSVSGALLNQNAVRIEPVETLQKGFLFYLLRSDHFKDYIIGTAQGAASQASITLDAIRSYKFECPDFDQQSEISDVLSNYDNLIENNNRRIAILEDIAQSLYREWFVKFRYPGHENQTLVDSPLGPIPEGWEVSTIDAVAKVKGGKRLPKGKAVLDQKTPYPYLRVKDFGFNRIDKKDIKYIDEESHIATERYIINRTDIYISIAGTIGRVGIVPKDLDGAHLTENAAKVCPLEKREWQFYLFRYLSSDMGQKLISARTGGASQPKLALYKVSEMPILLPPDDVLSKFDEINRQINELTENLDNKNQVLMGQRDMLLPKLISGKINLNDA